MARPSHAEVIGSYSASIEAARKFRREEGYDATWRRLNDIYRGKHFESASTEDRLAINIAFSTVNVIAPSVSVNYPKITVNARHPDAAAQAIITEALINYQWRKFRVRKPFRRAVKDFLIYGHGWLKVGWLFKEEAEVEASAPLDGEMDDVEFSTPKSPEIASNTIVIEDRPFVDRVSVHDIFVDPDADSEETMAWIAQRIRRPLRDVQHDDRYDKAGRDAVHTFFGRSTLESGDPAEDERRQRDTQKRYVDVWEFYDLKRNTFCTFAMGCPKFLVKPKPIPYDFGHPFVMIRNYDVPDHFYPLGDLEAIEPLQRELNEVRTAMMNHRKKYARKYLLRKAAFGDDGWKALHSDVDNTMVPVQGDEPLSDVLLPMPTEITPPEFYNQTSLIQQDIKEVSGVSEYMRGALSEIRRTATEAAITQDAANARAADKLAQIEAAIAEVAERLIGLAQQFMEGKQVARVTNAQGEQVWMEYDKDYIRGQFDFEVEAGSTAPVNESFRRQSALQMMDVMAPFIQLGVVNPLALAKHVLQNGFGIKAPEEFLVQQGPAVGNGPPPPGEVGPEGPMPPEAPMPGGPAPGDGDAAAMQALAAMLGEGAGNNPPIM